MQKPARMRVLARCLMIYSDPTARRHCPFSRLLSGIISAGMIVSLVTSAHAVEVGDVFGLSSSGPTRTVVGISLAQPGVVRVDYRLMTANASEFCKRYQSAEYGTPAYDKCVSEVMRDSRLLTALVNCRTKTIVLENGPYQKGADHFWKSKVDPNTFILGDELFGLSCGG
jgi:hypothetical protein